jgi:spore coat polysaccharide biosynthesis protein SpsF
MGSSRLPGKVLMDVSGKPALTRLVNRLRLCRYLDDIVVATSTAPADDAIESWAKSEGVACYRGSEDDVLQRVVEAHEKMQSEIIVEITGDCILTDPEVVDQGITTFNENDCDLVSNAVKPGYPAGICVQVFRNADLVTVAKTIDDPAVREHVSLYFYEHPELYRLIHMFPPARWWKPDWRLTLDYPEDLVVNNLVYQRLEPTHGDAFGTEEIVALLNNEPEILKINAHCKEKAVR